MKYKIIQTVLLLIMLIDVIAAQNNAIFEGGDGNGFSVAAVQQTVNNSIFAGGTSDGFGQGRYKQPLNNSIFAGGTADGFGVGSSAEQQINNMIFGGGESDGFATSDSKSPFIWTGTIGTGWAVAGNWNYNAVPDVSQHVIIPTGVPNWPFVNAGLLSIGDNPNNGQYKCASLLIQENAFLQTRIHCRVENYGLLQINGEMRIKKTTPDAIQNLTNGIDCVELSKGKFTNIMNEPGNISPRIKENITSMTPIHANDLRLFILSIF